MDIGQKELPDRRPQARDDARVSRSGIAMAAGRGMKIKREDAAVHVLLSTVHIPERLI